MSLQWPSDCARCGASAAQRSSFHSLCCAAVWLCHRDLTSATRLQRPFHAHLTCVTRLRSTTTPLHHATCHSSAQRHSKTPPHPFAAAAASHATRAHLLVMFSFAAKKVLGGATDKLKDKHDQAGGVNWYEPRRTSERAGARVRCTPLATDGMRCRGKPSRGEGHIQSAQQRCGDLDAAPTRRPAIPSPPQPSRTFLHARAR